MTFEMRGIALDDGSVSFERVAQPEVVRTTDNVSGILQRIFAWEPAADNRYSWQDFPGDGINISKNLRSEAAALRRNPREWQRFIWGDENLDQRARMTISVPDGPGGMKLALPEGDQICVAMDGGIVVPDLLAQIYSAGFASGLVAAWLIGKLVPDAELDIGDPDLLTAKKADLIDYPKYGNTHNAFVARMELLADQVPIDSQVMFDGWKVGLKLSAASYDIQQAVHEAVMSRFNWETIGEVTSHTLFYLLGFLQASSLNAPAEGTEEAISLDTLKSWQDPEVDKLSTKVEETMGQLYAALLDLDDVNVSRQAAVNVRDFLVGYHRGSIISSRELFWKAVQLGYGIGFRHGFKTGYARGYRDGKRAGFEKGLGNFLDDIVTITGNIKSIASDVARVVKVFGF